jgi:hypothetical protein
MQIAMEGVMKKGRIPKQFLGAFKKGHRFAAREYIDEELAEELLFKAQEGDIEALRALEFLTKFNNEHYKGVFKKDGSDFYKTKEDRRIRTNEQYAMKSDVLVRPTVEVEIVIFVSQPEEDSLIELLDLKRELEKSNKQ